MFDSKVLILLQLIRTALSLLPYSAASSSMIGAIILQGPHQGAQKSTNTGTGDLRTISSQVLSFTAPMHREFRNKTVRSGFRSNQFEDETEPVII